VRLLKVGKIAGNMPASTSNADDRRELLEMLARESYFERDLTLASGRASNYYIDCKRTLYLPRGAYLAGELMLELVRAESIEQLGGMAAGALPVTDAIIGAAWRHGYDLTGFFVRKETKAHGLQQQIEGAFRKERRTAVIDDTITTGGSSLQAVAAMREGGATVVAAFALVERGEGAADAFARAGLKYRWLFTAEEVRATRKPG
jgi:orotate phosphoribosyltransferase